MDEATGTARRWGVALVAALLACLGLWGPAAWAAETTTYVLTDVQGTVLAREDAQGATVATYDYRPYGKQQTGPVAAGPGYTGHVGDPDTGLVYMQQRYYDPGIGRFLSVDPVDALDEPILHFNRYGYAYNNPQKFNDPDGRCPMCIGALVGAVSDIAIQGVLLATGVQDHFDGKSVLISAGTGALGVGLAGKLGKLAEIAVDAGTSMVSSALKGEDITAKGVLADVIGGQIGGKAAGALERRIASSAEHKVAQRQANRLERIGNKPGARPAQQQRAASAGAALQQSVDQRAAVGGIAASNAASSATQAATKKDEN